MVNSTTVFASVVALISLFRVYYTLPAGAISYILLNVTIGGLDLISFFLAKTTLLSFPKTFPKNETSKVDMARGVITFMAESLGAPVIYWQNPALKKIHFDDVWIPSHDNKSHLLNLRIYSNLTSDPSTTLIKKKRDVVVFIHGGGFIIGSMKESQSVALQLYHYLATSVPAPPPRRSRPKNAKSKTEKPKIEINDDYLVVNLDYRLAPEYPFPTAVHDIHTELKWIEKNIEEKYNGNPNNIILVGESAGGNLAAAVTSRYLAEKLENLGCSPDSSEMENNVCPSPISDNSKGERFHPIKGLFLIYPVLNASTFSEEAQQSAYVNGFLTIDEIEWMKRMYQGDNSYNEEIRSHYWFSPLNTPDYILSHYPQTIMTLAEHDVLTPEGKEFIKKLESLRRPVTTFFYNSTIHAFVSAHPILGPRALREGVEEIKKFL
jgi:acetyl esterase/lipase